MPDIVEPRGLTRFYLPGRPARGRLVRLGPLADALLSRHGYHPVVSALTGEALALVAGLAAALKFRGSFSLQTKGDGAVSMLLADCTDSGALRGYARADAQKLEALLQQNPTPDAGALLGDGLLAFTVDQGPDQARHQGIVPLAPGTLADLTERYFANSEQIPARAHLAAGQTPAGWRASALIIERMPGYGGLDPALEPEEQEESWREAAMIAATSTKAELLDDSLSPEELLYRLYHAQHVAAERSRALSYGCRCSRARLARLLEGFGANDLDHMAADGEITMTCEFCNFDFRFQRDEIRSRAEGDASGGN